MHSPSAGISGRSASAGVLRRFVRLILDTLTDSFSDTKSAGTVITSTSPSGALRSGMDTESLLSTDNGKLRMPALATPGWARMGVAYPVQARTAGLAFIVRLIDGDVQAQVGGVSEHLAVGWFTSASPANPLTNGNALVLIEAGTAAGKLSRNGSALVNVISKIKQVELYLLVVLRTTGAVYYVGSLSGVREQGGYLTLRPLGIDTTEATASLYPSIWQRHMTAGSGNRTAAEAVQVAQIAAWSNWYTTAQAADTLIGAGSISGRTADGLGGTWTLNSGTLTCDATGAKATGAAIATLPVAAVGGLHKVKAVTGAVPGFIILRFRVQNATNYWWFGASATVVTLRKVIAGSETTVQSTGVAHLATNTSHLLQVIDDGTIIRAFFDQADPFGSDTSDTALATATDIGLRFTGVVDVWATNLESHPRTIALPATLDLGAPFGTTLGGTTVATEDFAGGAADLNGKTTATGGLVWRKDSGLLSLTGSGTGKVTTGTDVFYTVPWSSPAFADVALDVTPDGTAYAQGKPCRTGPLLWQDANNYLLCRVFVDDSQVNAAEFEIIYNRAGAGGSVVRRVNFGTEIFPAVLTNARIVSDGMNFVVLKNNEPVVCWSLKHIDSSYTAITINRVGIYAGSTDTGAVVDNWSAKAL